MNKKLIFAVVLALLMTSIPAAVSAKPVKADNRVVVAEEPLIFEDTITVDVKGGKYRVGFVTIQFLNRCLPNEQYPVEFTAKIYVNNGEAVIEISPDVDSFSKPVLIKVDKYSGYLYDEAKGENVYVNIKSQVIVAKHFSWYRFR